MTLTIGRNGTAGSGPGKRMARRPRGHEKIQINQKRFGYFPQQFTWRGSRYDVQAVERCWTVSRKRWGNKVERLFFRVRCAPVSREPEVLNVPEVHTFEVYQDLDTNTWHMAKKDT